MYWVYLYSIFGGSFFITYRKNFRRRSSAEVFSLLTEKTSAEDLFRQLSYDEVIAMLNFDLMDTLAGRQVYDMGLQKWLVTARQMLLDALDARFGLVPNKMVDQIGAINRPDVLKNLIKDAVICQNIGRFSEQLSS